MKSLRELKAGDRITLFGGGFHVGIQGFHTVAKARKLKFTLSDGSEWTMRGRRWGSTDSYGDWIELYEPEHDQQLIEYQQERRRRKLAQSLCDVRWRELPLEKLEVVSNILSPSVRAAAEEEA